MKKPSLQQSLDLLDQYCESNVNMSRGDERPSSVQPGRYKSSIRYTFITGSIPTQPTCLLSVTHSLKLRWDVFIMALAIWNCFYIPYAVAFMSTGENLTLYSIGLAIDIAYFADIAIYMRTTYVDLATGEEVTDSIKILKNYFSSGKLLVDVISAIPFDVLALFQSEHEGLQLITMTKIIRLLRLSKVFVFMRAKLHVKLRLKLLQLLFMFVVYLHLMACIWFMLIDELQVYIPPALYIEYHNEEMSLFHNNDQVRKYAYSLYMSVYMLTAAELGPRSSLERIFCGCAVLLGQLFQGYMFGEIAVVLFDLNKHTTLMTEIQDAASTTMTNMHLDSALQAKIISFLRYSQGRSRQQAEFEEFFRLLPPSMKQEVHACIFERVLVINPVISTHTEIKSSVLHRLQTLYCQPEEKIITQGEEPTAMFFMASGTCDVHVLDSNKHPQRMKTLGLGQHFGEIALVFHTNRTATVTSRDHATLAMLPKEEYNYLSYRYPKFVTLLKNTAVRYHDHWKRYLKKTLRSCPFFSHLNSAILSQIIYRLPITRYQASSFIYKEGEIADRVLFVVEGNIEVYIPLNDERLLLQSLDTVTKEASSLSPLSPRLRRSGQMDSIRKRHKLMFMVNVAMEELGMGSVLCPSLILLEEGKVQFCAQATETTIALTLTKSLLRRFCMEFPEIYRSVQIHANYLTDRERLTRMQRLQMTGLDYVCSFPDSFPQEFSHLWTAKMKVKRAVVGKLLEKREIRETGFQNVASLSRKIKGLILAESQGDVAMAEKIRRGSLPAQADLLFPALQLLHLAEVENPVLTQFAAEAIKIREAIEASGKAVLKTYVETRKLERQRRKLKRQVGEVTGLAQKLLRIQKAEGRSREEGDILVEKE